MSNYQDAMTALNKAISDDIQKMQRAEASDTDLMPLVDRIMETQRAMRTLKRAWEHRTPPEDTHN